MFLKVRVSEVGHLLGFVDLVLGVGLEIILGDGQLLIPSI